MQRRTFLGGSVTILAARSCVGEALADQPTKLPVVGYLSELLPPANLGNLSRGPIHQGLSEAGFVEGENMVSEYRWAEFHYDRLPALAADLVSRKVDLIVTSPGTPPALAAKNATSTIPIVFINVGDPVGMGLVANLARPGGNLTGFSNFTIDLDPKRLELLCELVPQARAIALLVNPANENAGDHIRITQEAARAKGVRLVVLKASSEAEIDAAFASLRQLQVEGLLVGTDTFFSSRREQIVALASHDTVLAVYGWPRFVTAGGLISYGIDETALYRQAGIYAGKILKGTKPADLPVQQPTTFELVVNLKTAKALGLTVPPSILARASEVIE